MPSALAYHDERHLPRIKMREQGRKQGFALGALGISPREQTEAQPAAAPNARPLGQRQHAAIDPVRNDAGIMDAMGGQDRCLSTVEAVHDARLAIARQEGVERQRGSRIEWIMMNSGHRRGPETPFEIGAMIMAYARPSGSGAATG